jgi:hypothetical protein
MKNAKKRLAALLMSGVMAVGIFGAAPVASVAVPEVESVLPPREDGVYYGDDRDFRLEGAAFTTEIRETSGTTVLGIEYRVRVVGIIDRKGNMSSQTRIDVWAKCDEGRRLLNDRDEYRALADILAADLEDEVRKEVYAEYQGSARLIYSALSGAVAAYLARAI